MIKCEIIWENKTLERPTRSLPPVALPAPPAATHNLGLNTSHVLKKRSKPNLLAVELHSYNFNNNNNKNIICNNLFVSGRAPSLRWDAGSCSRDRVIMRRWRRQRQQRRVVDLQCAAAGGKRERCPVKP